MATPAIGRRRTASCLRTAVFLFLVTFVWLQLHVATLGGSRQTSGTDGQEGNDSTAAILSMVPQVRPRHSCSLYCVLFCTLQPPPVFLLTRVNHTAVTSEYYHMVVIADWVKEALSNGICRKIAY